MGKPRVIRAPSGPASRPGLGQVRRVEVIEAEWCLAEALLRYRDLDDGSEHRGVYFRGPVAVGDRGTITRVYGWGGDYWRFDREEGAGPDG